MSVSQLVCQSVRPSICPIDRSCVLSDRLLVRLSSRSVSKLSRPVPGCGDVMLGGSCGFRCCVSIIMHKTFFVLQSSSPNVGISVYFWTFNQSHLVLKRCSRCRTSFCIQRKPTTTKTENISDKKRIQKIYARVFFCVFFEFCCIYSKKTIPSKSMKIKQFLVNLEKKCI